MAKIIITLKVMPESPTSDLNKIKENVSHLIKEFGGEVGKTQEIPVAFGLKSLNIFFVMDESLGSTEELEKHAAEISDVSSVEVIDVRKSIG